MGVLSPGYTLPDEAPGAPRAVGTVTLAQTATVAIALGIREVEVALPGAAPGGRYLVFCDSFRLNGGASQAGRPAGYAIVDATCRVAGRLIVSVQAPLLAIGQSYAFTCAVYQVP
jgi:hypothetical protein